ncbi:MAG: rRNA maturation RNase YbeY [Eubacteriales bacterium]|nr:rRNA maturation RNase YbeY [Eubacteriales bacterium]MDY3332977.1 rRNA maturation RNase YbeY [Gallibacter sp.]
MKKSIDNKLNNIIFIEIEDEIVINNLIMQKLYDAVDIALQLEDIDDKEVSVSLTLVDEDKIRDINSQFRDTDKVTDVLSFPQYSNIQEFEDESFVLLGDVVICDNVARKQAEEYGHSYEREFIYLFVHSIAHLLGYDHMDEEEKKTMRIFEEKIMSKLNLNR